MQHIQNKTISVTGGAGFIGANLCEHLLQHSNKVACLDNFATGRTSSIQHLLSNPDFTLRVGDIWKFLRNRLYR
jgi:UDP-N-acetylglucosamine 4-epimerase